MLLLLSTLMAVSETIRRDCFCSLLLEAILVIATICNGTYRCYYRQLFNTTAEKLNNGYYCDGSYNRILFIAGDFHTFSDSPLNALPIVVSHLISKSPIRDFLLVLTNLIIWGEFKYLCNMRALRNDEKVVSVLLAR